MLKPKKFVVDALGEFAKITYEIMNEVFHEYVMEEVIGAGKDLASIMKKAPPDPATLLVKTMEILEKRGVKKGGIPLLAIAASIVPIFVFPFLSSLIGAYARPFEREVKKLSLIHI